jgi:hypothetical protein
MMRFEVESAIEVLSRTPRVLDAMLRGISEPWARSNYGEDTFSPFDVVGHLIHGERTDWMPRLRIILDHGESRAFDPFDRYAMYEASRGRSMEELLDEFASLRASNIESLRRLNLTEAQLERTGLHPALGVVTLRNLLATWVAHDLNHVHQVAKCMAFQYTCEVGPWREYLTILPQP